VVVDIKQHKSQFKNSNFTITQSTKFFWADWAQIFWGDKRPRLNYVVQIWWQSV